MVTEPTARPGSLPVVALVCGLLFVIGAGLMSLPDAAPRPGQHRPAGAVTGPPAPSIKDRPPFAASGAPGVPVPPPAPQADTTASPPAGARRTGPADPTAANPPRTWPPGSPSGLGVAGPRPTGSAYASRDDLHPAGYRRSLIYSGLLGLAISMTGLAMVGWRRRLW